MLKPSPTVDSWVEPHCEEGSDAILSILCKSPQMTDL